MKYLRVDEQATYTTVYCDGYRIRIYCGTDNYHPQIQSSDGSQVYYFLQLGSMYAEGINEYSLPYDDDRTLEILEHTPTRVVLRLVGNLESSSNVTLTNSDSCTVLFAIYIDRIVVKLIWETSGTIDIDDLIGAQKFVALIESACTNEINIYESSGSEGSGDISQAKDSADYIGSTSDEINAITIDLDHTDDTYFTQYVGVAGDSQHIWNDADTFPAGIHTITTMIILDSAERAWGNKKYSSTERLEMGDQYKDTTLDDPITGSWADDLIIPANIGVDGFAADGAHHIDPSNDVSKITWDRTRHNPVVVIRDPGIKTGTIPGGILTYIDTDFQGSEGYKGVWGDGTYIYAACYEDGLRSYSVDGSGNLTYIDVDDQGGYYYDVWGDGTYLYVVCSNGGLRSYSVDSSGYLTYIDTDFQGGPYYGIWGDGTYIYITDLINGLRTYSVDSSGNLTYIDTDFRSGFYYNVWGDGTYIYAACSDGLRSYSVDSSGYLTYIDTDYQGGDYRAVWGDGTYIYVVCNTDGLRSYSVDSSGYLTYIDTDFQGSQGYRGVWGDGTYIYAACLTDGLRSYSVDSSGYLTYIDTDYQGDSNYYGVWGDGTYIYAACDTDGLRSYSVSSIKDHLIAHWRCNDNAASTTIVDETGNYDGTLGGGDNTEDKDSTNAVRGTSLLLNGTDDYLDFSAALAGITDKAEFTILFSFLPTIDADDSSDNYPIIDIASNSNNRVKIHHNSNQGDVELAGTIDSVLLSSGLDVKDYSSLLNEWKQWHTMMVCFNLNKGMLIVAVDNEVCLVVSGLSDWGTDPAWIYLGRYTTTYMPVYFDEVKLYDGCLLPFGGGPFTGNGEVNTSLAHSDILFHWDCESSGANASNIPTDKTITLGGSAAISSGGVNGSYELDTIAYSTNHYASIPVVGNDIINPHKGSFQSWIKINSSGSDYDVIFGFGDADDYLIIRISNTDELQYIYRSQSTYFTYNTGETLTVGQWYHIKAIWDDTDSIYLYLDGVLPSTPAQVTKTWDGITSGTIYLGANYSGGSGADVSFDQIFITDNPNTPDRWSVFGKPVHEPLFYKDGVLQQAGLGHQLTRSPSGHIIAAQAGDVE